jgi:hypothetical protein
MILVGSFHGEQGDEGFKLEQPFKGIFMGVMFVGIIAIFLDALGWMDKIFDFLDGNWDSEWMMSIFLILVVVIIMIYITGGFAKKENDDNDDK